LLRIAWRIRQWKADLGSAVQGCPLVLPGISA